MSAKLFITVLTVTVFSVYLLLDIHGTLGKDVLQPLIRVAR